MHTPLHSESRHWDIVRCGRRLISRVPIWMLIGAALFHYSAQAAERPVVEYRFDENPGLTIRDTSGNGLHARNEGGLDHSAPVWGAGHSVTGMQFDGAGDLINLGDRDELDLNRYTIMAWVKYRDRPAGQSFVPLRAERGKRLNNEIIEKIGAYWLNIRLDTRRLRSGGRFGGPSRNGCRGELPGTVYTVDSGIPVPANTWTHVATSYNGAKLKVFINGKLVGSKTVERGKCDSDHPAVLGAKYTPRPYKSWPTGYVSNNFNGVMDDFRVYDYALTGTEILASLGSDGFIPDTGQPTGSLGGTVSGMLPRLVKCREDGKRWFAVSANEAEWLCEAGGLTVSSGQPMRQLLAGRATNANVMGTVSGMQPRKFKCDNVSTGIKRWGKLSGTDWACGAVGVNVRAGDQVRVLVLGVAD